MQNLVLISDRSIRDPRDLRKWGTFSATMFNININLCAKNIGHCHLKTLNSKIWLVILPSCSYTFPLSATRGPLDFPSEKSFLFFFRPKVFRTHDSKIVLLFSTSLFLRRHHRHHCKFQRFCPARSDCSNVAHGILSCYKLQGVFS